MNNVKFVCPLITVEDMERARNFYEKVLGQKVETDFGANVSFGGFAIHLRSHYQMLIGNKEIANGSNSFELYFEYDDLAQMVDKLKTENVEFVHELREQPWKQLVVRFYDPDKNIVEIGETMDFMICRLHRQGNSSDAIAQMTGLQQDFIEQSLQNQNKTQ